MKIFTNLLLLFSISINLSMCMELSLSDDEDNLFEIGLTHLLEDIQGCSDERVRLLNPEMAININSYMQPKKVSQETKKLITGFLSLPKELQVYIVPFLDNAALAYFVHLKCVSRKTRKEATKKIMRNRTMSMINRLQKKPDNTTICNLFDEAIHIGRQSKNPFSDLRALRAQLNRWIIQPKVFFHLLSEYKYNTIQCSNEFPNNKYRQLRKEFLKLLSTKIDKKIKRYNQCTECMLLSRYCISGELCCLSALFIVYGALISSPIPLFLSAMSCVACSAYSCSCCMPNLFCNCPEKNIAHSCAQKCETDFYLPCSAITRVTTPLNLPYSRYIDLGRMGKLHKAKKAINLAIQGF